MGSFTLKTFCTKLIIPTLSFFLATSTSLAAEGDDEPPKKSNGAKQQRTSSGKKIVDPEDAIVKGSSEYNREGKSFYAAVELLGLNPLSSSGLMAGKYFGPDSIIDASWTRGQFEFLGFKMESSTYGIRYKRFNGNSFYWRVGGMVRTFDYNTSLTVLSSDASTNGKVSVTSVGVDGAIGNQWQWDSFTLGCDWIGLFVPLTGSYSIKRPEGATDSWYQTEKTDAEKLSKRGNTQALRFYLGASF